MAPSSNQLSLQEKFSRNASNVEEHRLWLLVQNGDQIAFSKLLERYYPLLMNYGVRIKDDPEFVKDCLQDLFVEIWNRRQQLETVNNLKPYLLASLRRRVIRESRRLRWFREAREIQEDDHFDVQFSIENYLINNEIKHESLIRLKMNLNKLTKRQREVIYLRFYQELEYEEISNIMDINRHSAVNLIYEALKLMRKNWFLSWLLIMPILVS
ncbi:RNA polymerase sigma factor [Dyadobacter tibetensis]|uniref:RNA polymerase sigma factor n=1 Tax=Dyadobacter tibetensis TaxID=1211851 RepID=UPI000471ADF5|nr:sigma-70 family RNA polymerase sigma factor [Dyadobacter tibetensis]